MSKGRYYTNIAELLNEREELYGPPEQNLQLIADLWSAYLGVPVSITDVCMLFNLAKIGRVRSGGKHHDDNFDDQLGYALIAKTVHHATAKKAPSEDTDIVRRHYDAQHLLIEFIRDVAAKSSDRHVVAEARHALFKWDEARNSKHGPAVPVPAPPADTGGSDVKA